MCRDLAQSFVFFATENNNCGLHIQGTYAIFALLNKQQPC